MNQVEIFTDGACKGNPGAGGWGAIIRINGEEKYLHGGSKDTTNNRMELTAAIKALEALSEPSIIVLTTDSEYLRKGITEWMMTWKARDWKTSANKPVLNKDLWLALNELTAKHTISWEWVKGHSGHRENEIADMLANKGIEEL